MWPREEFRALPSETFEEASAAMGTPIDRTALTA
jgi:hypothetical protein